MQSFYMNSRGSNVCLLFYARLAAADQVIILLHAEIDPIVRHFLPKNSEFIECLSHNTFSSHIL